MCTQLIRSFIEYFRVSTQIDDPTCSKAIPLSVVDAITFLSGYEPNQRVCCCLATGNGKDGVNERNGETDYEMDRMNAANDE